MSGGVEGGVFPAGVAEEEAAASFRIAVAGVVLHAHVAEMDAAIFGGNVHVFFTREGTDKKSLGVVAVATTGSHDARGIREREEIMEF